MKKPKEFKIIRTEGEEKTYYVCGTCGHTTLEQPKESWEEDWRKLQDKIDWVGYNCEEDPDELMKQFISSLLAAQREEIKEWARKAQKP